MQNYIVTIDGESWNLTSPQAEYDAIHTVAGAVLAGADDIRVETAGNYAYDQ